MKTSRLKTIVIVILLLVNAFLLFLLLSRRAEERDSNERRIEQLCTLFEKNGVDFDRALLPDEETHLSLSLERNAAREEDFASALLGTATAGDSGGGVSRFTGEYGSCSIRSGGTVDALVSRPVDDPEDFCRQLFKTFGYTLLSSQLADGSGSVTGVRSEKGRLIFNASLMLTFSDGSLTGASGTFLPALNESRRTTAGPRSTRANAPTASTRSTRSCIFWTIAALPALSVRRSARWTRDIFSRRRPPRRCGCKACGASPRTSAVIM